MCPKKERGRVKLRPSSEFKNALMKLNRIRSVDKQCDLIKNSSDKFVRDLSLVVKHCLPGIQPLVSPQGNKQLKKFISPRTSMMSRRAMMKQKGGFLQFLANIVKNVWHTLFG